MWRSTQHNTQHKTVLPFNWFLLGFWNRIKVFLLFGGKKSLCRLFMGSIALSQTLTVSAQTLHCFVNLCLIFAIISHLILFCVCIEVKVVFFCGEFFEFLSSLLKHIYNNIQRNDFYLHFFHKKSLLLRKMFC